jgi:hypothetical protein
MSDVHEFEVSGKKFQLSPLKLEPQMEGLAVVSGALLPAFVAFGNGAQMKPSDVAEALNGLDKLPKLFKLFEASTKVDWNGAMVPLKDFRDLVFSRRPDMILGYVAECVWAEYSAFLGEAGKSTLSKAANRFAFLLE